MQNTPRTYRLAPALLALVVLLTGAGPLLAHLCAGMDLHGGAEAQAHACCAEHCADHPPATPGDAADGACCAFAPLAPATTLAVDAPAVPRVDGALFAAVAPIWAEVAEAPTVRPRVADRGGPPLPVRSHLAFSILLI